MSLEPSTLPEPGDPPSAPNGPSETVQSDHPSPAPTPVPDKPSKPVHQRFWDAAKTITLIASMVINLILIVAVVTLANQVGAIKLTLYSVLGQLDSAFEDLAKVVVNDTIHINQQVPVRFDLPLRQDTVVTTNGAVPITTQATFSLGQFGSINGTVSLQLPPGTSLPVHLELTVPVSNSIPVVFDQPVSIPLVDKGLGPVVAKLRAALGPIIDLVKQLPDRFVIVPQ